MTRSYVGLGANLDDPGMRVREAMRRLEELPGTQLVAHSSLYLSEPWGETDQPPFVNAVSVLDTVLEPGQLMVSLLDLEREMGRVREARRWGPRRIDLDLLVYGGIRQHVPGLTLPHPRLHERAFVLVPLAEVAPDLEIPGRGPVRKLLARVDTGGVEKLETANERK